MSVFDLSCGVVLAVKQKEHEWRRKFALSGHTNLNGQRISLQFSDKIGLTAHLRLHLNRKSIYVFIHNFLNLSGIQLQF